MSHQGPYAVYMPEDCGDFPTVEEAAVAWFLKNTTRQTREANDYFYVMTERQYREDMSGIVEMLNILVQKDFIFIVRSYMQDEPRFTWKITHKGMERVHMDRL